jgi:hypothetical protein
MNISFSPIAKYDTISLQQSANSTATKLTFPDQPQLRGKKICGIEMPYVAYDLNGATTVNTTAETYNNAFITLFFEGIEGVYRMPLLELVYIFGSGSNRNFDGIYSINDKDIIWTKSYITLSSPSTPATNVVYCLGVYYR